MSRPTEKRILIQFDIDNSTSMKKYWNEVKSFIKESHQSFFYIEDVANVNVNASYVTFSNVVKSSSMDDNPYKICTSDSCGTKLYDSIIECKRILRQYKDEDMDQFKKTVLVIITDGIDTTSIANFSDAKAAIKDMQDEGVVIGFVTFGIEEFKKIALELGVDTIINWNPTKPRFYWTSKMISLKELKE